MATETVFDPFAMSITKPTSFGECFQHHRAALGLTLRKFCQVNGFDPGNISKLERGIHQAPEDRDILAKYARVLGLVEGTAAWREFSDFAAADRGRLPDELLADSELVKRLPALLRTIDDKKLTPAQLDRLIELIRQA